MTKSVLFSVAVILSTWSAGAAQGMDNDRMQVIIESVGDSIQGISGAWQFHYSDRLMIIFTDEGHDRMRIISPVKMADQVDEEEMRKVLEANFHSALDVKYAISDGVMWTTFIHPLGALDEEQFRDALLQVYRACETYGSTYSSTELIFPGARSSDKQEQAPVKKM